MTKNTKLALMKSISWHIVHSIILGVTVFALTGELNLAAGIISVHVLSETVIYYLHERAWQMRGLKFRRKRVK